MIPTMHLRYVLRSASDDSPAIQQLWAPTLGLETLFYPLEYLLENGAEWRPLPAVMHGYPQGF